MEFGDARRVVRRRRDDGADRLRRAEHVAHDTRLDDAPAERGRHLVAATHHDERVGAPVPSPRCSHGSIGPSGACACTTGASRSRSTPNASHASGDHARERGSRRPVDDALEGSTASTPDARQAIHEPGSRNAAAAAATSGSWLRQPANLRGDVARVEIAAGQRAQLGLVHASRDLVALSAGAAVAPDERGSERRCRPRAPRPARRVASRTTARRSSRPAHASRTPAQGADQRPQPFVAVLLGPARPRIRELVRRRSSRPRASRRVRAPVRTNPANRRRRRPRGARSCAGNVPASAGRCESPDLRYGSGDVRGRPVGPSRRANPARACRCRLGARARARTRTASRSCSRAAACAAWSRPAWSLRWSGSGMRDAFDLIVGSSAGRDQRRGAALRRGAARRRTPIAGRSRRSRS